MRILLLIIFGVLGTLSRYGLQGLVQYATGFEFPTGTLSVNLLGCFFLGIMGQFALNHASIPPDWRIGIMIGFFGAFTTFSTFSWETVHLLDGGDWIRATLYVGASLVGGLFLLKTGMSLANRL